MITELDISNFDKETKNGVKLIEFFTTWCGYCKKQQPELEALDKLWIGQVDAEESPTIAAKYNINSFPTFLIMKNGKVMERFSGSRKKEEILNSIMKYVK